MTPGQKLFDYFIFQFRAVGGEFYVPPSWLSGWAQVPPVVQNVWELAASDVRSRDWQIELRKFGRHHPSCDPCAECSCGFGEIEKELAA